MPHPAHPAHSDPADPRNRIVGYYQHLQPDPAMTTAFDTVSVWDPDSDGPTFTLGRGRLEIDTDHAAIRVATAKAKHVNLPADIEGYAALATKDGDIVYEGTVEATDQVVTGRGQRKELQCDPAERADE